jgi:1-phosphofructokinase family hexose kinase
MIRSVTLNPSLDRTLTVPRIRFNEMTRATSLRLDWGGKGFNVSRALQALGAESVAMGFAGGATGEMLARGMAGLGIDTDLVIIAGETRTNTIVTEKDTGRYLKVNEAGPTIGTEELSALLHRVQEQVQPGDLWVLSGSLPPGVSPDLYGKLIRIVQTGGAWALLDTSGEPLRLGCMAGPYLVKPNAFEAGEVTGCTIGSEVEVLDAAGWFLQKGVELVAISLGVDGLLLACRDRMVKARPPRVQAHHPVGAGDALLAGIAWALHRGLPLEEVARWGVAAGTAAAMRVGVAVGSGAEVQALYDRVEISTR